MTLYNVSGEIIMLKLMSILVICTVLSSCCTQKFMMNETNPTIPTKEGTSHFVFWGIGQEKIIDPKEICGNKISSVETSYSFVNGLLSGITFGIYSPRSYSIYCQR